MLVGTYLLDVQKDDVSKVMQTVNVGRDDGTVSVEADMDSGLTQALKERNELAGLHRRLAAGKGYAAAPPVEGPLVNGHLQDMLRVGFNRLATRVNSVRIGTIQTAEGAALEEDYQTQSGAIECPHAFIRMDAQHFLRIFKFICKVTKNF